MKITNVLITILIIALAACSQDEEPAPGLPSTPSAIQPVATTEQPGPAQKVAVPDQNILLIVADDVGYADLGAYGSEIEKHPISMRLARGRCPSSRIFMWRRRARRRVSMFVFPETDNHLAGVGNMLEVMRTTKSELLGSPGYEGYLNFRVASLANLMHDAGYHTYMSGKWHLGLQEENQPCRPWLRQVLRTGRWRCQSFHGHGT